MYWLINEPIFHCFWVKSFDGTLRIFTTELFLKVGGANEFSCYQRSELFNSKNF